MKIAQKIELVVIVGIIAAVVMLLRSDIPLQSSSNSSTPRVASAAATPSLARHSVAAVPADGSLGVYNLWKARFEEAQAALAQGDNERAEASLAMALQLAPDAGPNAVHETLDDLGLVCYRLGDYQRSAEYQRQAVAATATLPPADRQATLGLYESRYAQALEALGDRDGALAALDRSEQAYREAYPVESAAFSEVMNTLAAQHRSLGDNDGAARIVGGI